ncbi:SDR family oxidoreductase [Candidatus Contendibacter odensensis]|uniref:Short-chain alcohol dehydrogenase-like protein n=1 Tax=Candidatus Contendobacter odensis Run_B_J11 TaxID=1400861 RepID=A0A7U7GAL5_9GAMM|nr:SDR family oxidoreductase [Candidatus Contendobacter odensis]CDH44907.1 Short-chain alcohol dehydrogenase-like protein [Candidatus Contendobacter odensis Run_B_J11]
MNYFVTGATGFIGRRLVEKLLQRPDTTVYYLILERELPIVETLRLRWGAAADRTIPIIGDLTLPRLGVAEIDLARLKGQIQHLFHLAAIYDLKASAEIQEKVNVAGTRNVVAFAEAVEVGCFHLTSSIAAAGLYEGVFREDMFEEAEELDHPYYRTKHESEGIVRRECSRPWRVYRPGIVVGDSRTGEMDKIDGPYYFFKLIQKLRKLLPPWMPVIGIEGGRQNLVPVNFIVDAMDHIAHQPNLDGQCFHLVDPHPHRVGDILNLFARAAHAPEMSLRVNALMFAFVPEIIKTGLAHIKPVQRMRDQVLKDLGMPGDVMRFVNYPTRFDCRETLKALKGTDIAVPPLESYAWKLWDYWERHLDPELFIDRSLNGAVKNKVVLITGASSGIGKAAALKIAEAGAKVLIVARTEEKLRETQQEIQVLGGSAFIYTADVADIHSCDALIRRVLEDHGGVDILINNAGRSIRRSIEHSLDRFHDYERTMQLNYFGALRLIMGFIPTMLNRKRGHVINISSIGVLSNAPRFSAYVSSKAALDAFSRCAVAEFSDSGIEFTTINMPLVRTPMIAPTKLYQHIPTLSPEEAADLIVQAIIYKPERIATRIGIFAQVLHAVAPKLYAVIMNTAFRLFPESTAAKGQQPSDAQEPSLEQISFAQFTRGIYW